MHSQNDLTILAACENRDYLLILKHYAQEMGIFSTFQYAFTGKEALDKFKKHRPHIFILSLILPVMDGLGVLEKIAELGIKGSSKIIVVSGVGGDFFIKKSFKYGADYFFIKPVSYEMFKNRILDLLNEEEKTDAFLKDGSSMANIITIVIQRLGLPAGSKGYNYARYALHLILNDKKILQAMTKKLYPAIAEHFSATSSRVERDIRHAVEVAWNKGDIAYIERLFGYTVDANRGKPTNSAFFATVADYIHINLLKVN